MMFATLSTGVFANTPVPVAPSIVNMLAMLPVMRGPRITGGIASITSHNANALASGANGSFKWKNSVSYRTPTSTEAAGAADLEFSAESFSSSYSGSTVQPPAVATLACIRY